MHVRVIRAQRQGPNAMDIVQRPDGLQIAVPRWMLDPLVCQQFPQEAKPRGALRSLQRLRELVPTRRLPVGSEASVLEVSPRTQDDHACRNFQTPVSGCPAKSLSHSVTSFATASRNRRGFNHRMNRTH